MSMCRDADYPLRGMSVLVVEDEAFVGLALRDQLRAAGAEAVLAGTLADAQARAAVSRYSAAVLDVRLPDGLSVSFGADLCHRGTAVVFHSGQAGAPETADVPGAAFCAKPTTPEQIVAAILSVADPGVPPAGAAPGTGP